MRGVLFAAVGAVLSLAGAHAQSPVVLNESGIRAVLRDDSTVVTIPIESRLERSTPAALVLEWLTKDDRVVGSARQDTSVAPGKSAIEAPLPIAAPSIWLRLRYSLGPVAPDVRAFFTQTGIVALPSIASHVFELKVMQAGVAYPGKPLTLHAQAVHPLTHAVVHAVNWDAELKLADVTLKPAKISERPEGFVDVVFNIPSPDDFDGDQASLEVSAELGDFAASVSTEVSISSRFSGSMQTDKPIYQPGQTMHVRAIVLDPQSHAVDGRRFALRIDDEEGNRVHTAQVVSSRFGIVQDDWALPASADLGTYRLTLVRSDDEDNQIVNHAVRVSRYELPAFSVTARPDRTAYLAGQPAKVTITGALLFGKPVPKGHVKVTRDARSSFGRRSRKPDPEEIAAEGTADDNGSFVATLDLEAEREDLASSNYDRFKDLHFIAYYTDPTSRRTEQRRFDVRITRDTIHVYLIDSQRGWVYVSTSYADGTPASVDAELRCNDRRIQLHTNRYGVAKAAVGGRDECEELSATARDSNGQTGSWTDRYRSPLQPFRIDTSHTIHRAGEPVFLSIHALDATLPDEFVLVHATIDGNSVANRIAHLVNGNGQVTFPYQPEFHGTVVFATTRASRAVIFPDASDLRVTAVADKTVYRPGEKATVRMQVSSADGRPTEAALGLAVVDQAVMERARTDAQFGQRHWFSCAFCASAGEEELGGIRLNDLYAIKPGTPISPDLDLIAEVLVSRAGALIRTESSEDAAKAPQFAAVSGQIASMRAALDQHYARTLEIPHDDTSFAQALGPRLSALTDPWGKPWRATFAVARRERVITLVSTGPDKTLGTEDDLVLATFERSWFAPMESLIRETLKRREDYPVDESAFREQLRADGLLLETLHDPWGTLYQVLIDTFQTTRTISLFSAGPDRRFNTSDDFFVARFSGSYFRREREAISRALATFPRRPETIEEFQQALAAGGIDVSRYRDTRGQPYRVTATPSVRYSDRLNTMTVRVFGGQPAPKTTIEPITEHIVTFALHSGGRDGLDGTYDDFDVARFVTVLSTEGTAPPFPPLLAGTGAVRGIVADTSGGIMANTRVVLLDGAEVPYETYTDEAGVYLFASVPAGTWKLRASPPGFRSYEVSSVPVTSGQTTVVDITLEVGGTDESVTVTAEASVLATETSSISSSSGPMATPRVREYFPETLLWAPEILTDAHGNARLQFNVADNVTTWKIAVIASTLDGRIVEGEGDFRSFQPFFLDLNPPLVLTEGDRIDLPITVRNYEDSARKVSVSIQPNDWSATPAHASQSLTVAANSSVNVTWMVEARRSRESAHTRVTAISARRSDAIDKTLRVHPDGQEITRTVADLVAGKSSFAASIPPGAIDGATRGELRLYPNMASLLLESARAVLDSPHGCAEQTISAGYANLIALRYARAAGIHDPRIEKIALAHITAAIDALPHFSDYRGGLSYWGSGDPDIAVSAYALNFLADASGIVPGHNAEMQTIAAWLEKANWVDGRLAPADPTRTLADRQAALLTGLVARSLAAGKKAGVKVNDSTLDAAYKYIAQFTSRIDEPYLLAQFILAAADSGDAASRLVSLAREEKGGLYWDLQSNSPFYGWGTAGRLETTGLVVSALSAWRASHPDATTLDPVIRRGLVFLLRSRDRYGSWLSTQSTVRVMRAMADAAPHPGPLGGSGGSIDIRVNGKIARSVTMPRDSKSTDPIIVDVSTFLRAGETQVELEPTAGTQNAMMLFSSTYWLPWTNAQPRTSGELRLSVRFDRLDAPAGEPVRCSVKAERVGFRGYGMMIAEVGLPPGAEVDRESLESVIDETPGLDRYDVLPDKVLFYLWPQAGGAVFDFQLRARTPMTAKSSPSVLYDYYNPKALTELPPFAWSVK
jgi:hypothetical protein